MMNEIERKIAAALEHIPSKVNWSASNKEWTMAIKEAICGLGYESGFGVHATGDFAADREWLYDIAWYDLTNDSDERITRLVLALECEWCNVPKNKYRLDVKYDFEKLLQARAEYRVMIFETGSIAEKDEIITYLKKGIDLFQGTMAGDRYLFAVYVAEEPHRFYFESFGVP